MIVNAITITRLGTGEAPTPPPPPDPEVFNSFVASYFNTPIKYFNTNTNVITNG